MDKVEEMVIKKTKYELKKDQALFKSLNGSNIRFQKNEISTLMEKYTIPFRIMKQLVKDNPDNWDLEEVYDTFKDDLFNITIATKILKGN